MGLGVAAYVGFLCHKLTLGGTECPVSHGRGAHWASSAGALACLLLVGARRAWRTHCTAGEGARWTHHCERGEEGGGGQGRRRGR